jgi:secreted Zn-dependent insulinase-like peptidase
MKMSHLQAALGLCIGVGSFSDPWSVQGMAHFLEHMVFMGSEKYPKENDFDAFIKVSIHHHWCSHPCPL